MEHSLVSLALIFKMPSQIFSTHVIRHKLNDIVSWSGAGASAFRRRKKFNRILTEKIREHAGTIKDFPTRSAAMKLVSYAELPPSGSDYDFAPIQQEAVDKWLYGDTYGGSSITMLWPAIGILVVCLLIVMWLIIKLNPQIYNSSKKHRFLEQNGHPNGNLRRPGRRPGRRCEAS